MDSENQENAVKVEDAVNEPLTVGSAMPVGRIEPLSSTPSTQLDTTNHSIPPGSASPLPASLDANRLTINYLVVALVFLGIGVLFGRLIFGGTGASGVDETALRQIVAEAVASGGGGAPNTQTAQLIDDDPIMGAKDAPITIVEFSDFNCPFCGRFATETQPRLLEEYEGQIRFVYRDLPIIGQQLSVETAIAAECADDQGKFTEYHDLLYSNMEVETRTREVYVSYAAELELDADAFTACLDDPAKSDEVMLDMLDGQSLGITGTPGFYINGRFISGALPYELFKTVIDREIERAGIDTTGSSS